MQPWMIVLGLLSVGVLLYYKHKQFHKIVEDVPWSFMGTVLGMTSIYFSYHSPVALNTVVGIPIIADTPSRVWLIVGVILVSIGLIYMVVKETK